MGQHRYSEKIIPKFQDLDTDIKYIKQGGVRYMKNLRLGSPTSSSLEVLENIKGTLEVPFDILPNGENKCVLIKEDWKNNRIIFGNWNSQNNHCIYVYLINENLIVEAYKDTPDNIILDFVPDYNMLGTKTALVDGKHLFWTDKYNAQRYLDIDKAIEYNKKKIWHVRELETEINVSVNDTDYEFLLTDIPNEISNLFDIESCDCKWIFKEKDPNILKVISDDFIPQNFYPKPHNERQIDFILYPPHTAPKLTLINDEKYKRNFLDNNTWQFRTRYKYRNGAYSVWSAWSKLVCTAFDCGVSLNCIQVDYSADIFNEFNDNTEFNLIDGVELGYRNTNSGELAQFIYIKQCEIPKTKQIYSFYNDIHSEIQPEIDDILSYDDIPVKSGTLGLAGDRILLGDNTVGYKKECFDFDVDIKFTPNSGLIKKGSLKTKIRIWNKDATGRYKYKQPIISRDKSVPRYGGVSNDNLVHPSWADVTLQDEFDQKLPEGGFIGYLAGTDYMGISRQIKLDGVSLTGGDKNIIKFEDTDDWHDLDDNIDSQELYSVLEIKDIPIGRYIFRLASHLCSYGDKLKKGVYYDLSEPDLYQRTSTNVYGIIEEGELKEGVYEFVVDITEDTETIIPDFVIYDLIHIVVKINDTPGSAFNAYVFDNDKTVNKSTLDEFVKGIAVEQATFEPEYDDNSQKATRTDHNGYCYSTTPVGDDTPFTTRLRVYQPFMDNKNLIAADDYVYRSKGNSLSDFYNGTADAIENNTYGTVTPMKDNYCFGIPNYRQLVRQNNRTRIKGRLIDSNGNPIKGIDYVVSKTNRKGKTDAYGKFEVVLYVDLGGAPIPFALYPHIQREIIFYSKSGCLSLSFSTENFLINKIGEDYNDTNSFDLGDIEFQLNENLGQKFYLKNGGVYDFGVQELDRGNRKSALYFDEKKHRIRLPFTTEKVKDYFPELVEDTQGNPITADTQANGIFSAEIKLKSEPSVWSTHLYTLRTQDQVYADYLQFAVSDVKYVIMFNENSDGKIEPEETSYLNKNANEIYLDLNSTFSEYKKINTDSEKGWTYEKGDRIRFIYKDDGELFDRLYEVPLKGQRGNWFVLENIESMPEIKQGALIELFRLKQKRQSKIFYETSEYTKVSDRYLPTRYFNAPNIILNTGDAYRRNRRMRCVSHDENDDIVLIQPFTYFIEDSTPSDIYIGKDNDIGRPSAVNENNTQIHRKSSIKFGGKYIVGSFINELHRFIPTDIVETNNDYGAVTIISDFENVLFVAQERKCHVRYINKTRANLGTGQEIVLDASSFLSSPDYFMYNYGCTNPESYARSENSCFFFDGINGLIGQYTPQNGLINISGNDIRYNQNRGQDKYFKDLKQVLDKIPVQVRENIAFIVGGYHTIEYNELFVTNNNINLLQGQSFGFLNKVARNSNTGENDYKFKDYSDILLNVDIILNKNTIAYDNRRNYWYGDRGTNGEAYITLGDNAFALKNGRLWIMDKSDVYNVFFGVADNSVILIVANDNPSEIKDFQNFSIESNELWENRHNIVPFSPTVGREQLSVTLNSLIENKNGVFYGAIYKDINTPNVQDPLYNGKDMIGGVMTMEFSNSSIGRVELYAINVYAGYVPRTNF